MQTISSSLSSAWQQLKKCECYPVVPFPASLLYRCAEKLLLVEDSPTQYSLNDGSTGGTWNLTALTF
jgi:hypothetical protein